MVGENRHNKIMRDDIIVEHGFRFRWRDDDDYKGCKHCALEPYECPNDCDKEGYYSMLSDDEWLEVRMREFLETHPNFGNRIFKKLDALLIEFKENFDKLNNEQIERYLNNCNYLKELFKKYVNNE